MLSRRIVWFLAISVAMFVVDVWLVGLPGPVPTSQAIYNVEHSPTFLSLTSSRVINGSTVNGTYAYAGFSNDPSRDFVCVNSIYHQWLHFFNPFHEYTTTSLLFAVEFRGTHPISDNTYVLLLVNLLLQVNPTTGQIYRTQESLACA